ncbi:MAG: serine--tRNA ligase [Deltaproteobacteria bacterium]|nr:serine--tRNA ligase [Deltaproteobacteria bacterium]
MIDPKLLTSQLEKLKASVKNRGDKFDLNDILQVVDERKKSIQRYEELQSTLNNASEKIAVFKKDKKNATTGLSQLKKLSLDVKEASAKKIQIEEIFLQKLLYIPCIPDDSVPVGANSSDNQEVQKWGTLPNFQFKPKSHVELASQLGIIDFKMASAMSGAKFALYKGWGAKLERALINFFLDQNSKKGYEEVFPPFIVARHSMVGTGQLPKFEEEAFKIEGWDSFLIPTAEVPITNMYRDSIMDEKELPKAFTAYSACFRKEAGSYGKDTSGLIRQHQFNKVELVKFVKPEHSFDELEKLTLDAQSLLQALEIPYRVMSLCTGDLGFSSSKTYDIEVWIPSQNCYREISSCSNFVDFQARRANIRFRSQKTGKLEFVHTINGSAIAVGRTVVALLENFQLEDGSVKIPEVLQPYLGIKLLTVTK